MSTAKERLEAMGLTLPKAAAPVANYVPFVRTGNLVVISGQICFGPDGTLDPAHLGKLGAEVSVENGIAAARLCAINVLPRFRRPWATSTTAWCNACGSAVSSTRCRASPASPAP